MTRTTLPAIVAILVDDTATLTIEENNGARPPGVTGPFFRQTYTVNGTALWNPKSYKEFDIPLPPGRKYNLTLNYANLANLTKRYGGKTDVDGGSVYVCLMPLEITTETIAKQPANRDRKKIGIGEEVKLGIRIPADAHVIWNLADESSGELSQAVDYSANEIKFIASALEKKATVEATLTNYGNAKVSVSFDVIRPQTIFFEKVGGRGVYWDAASNGFMMDLSLDWYFGPDDVNFYALEAGETGTKGKVTGWFAKPENKEFYEEKNYHDAWIGNEVLRRPPMPPQVNHDNNGLLS